MEQPASEHTQVEKSFRGYFMIRNTTKKSIIAGNREICSSILSKAKGLMFSLKSDKAKVFIFNTEARRGLHMLFVFFPIDVIFLDKNKRVVEMKENLLPFTLYFPKRKAQYIIEAEKGTIRKSRTKVGDKVKF